MMIPSDLGFSFTGLVLLLPFLVLIIYAIVKIRNADPSKRRKYVAIAISVVLIVSVSTIVILNLPPVRRIELDITLNFRSNSTNADSTHQYHWDAPGIQIGDYGILINWNNEGYAEAHSYGTGVLNELLLDRAVETFNMQWTEIEAFANSTWTLLMDFFVGAVFNGQLVLRGNNQSAQVDNFGITGTDFSSILLEGLDALGIEELEVYMDISFKIKASVLRSCFREISTDFQIVDDIELAANNIAFGVIS